MVSLESIAAAGHDTARVIAELDAQIAAKSINGRFVYAFYGCDHDDNKILSFLKARFSGAAILGGTSCSGIMTEQALWGPQSIGLLVVDDADGDYGVASAPLGVDASATAESVLRAALSDAGCPGELPELIWVFQAPGREEDVIEGLRRVVGDRCPIIGGSSADNTVAGEWRQISTQGVFKDGVVVAALFPSGGIGYAYQGGYEPAGPSGVVTRIGYDPSGPSGLVTKAGAREIIEIDGKPAAEVYNAWIDHALDDRLASGGNILLDTTMCPIACDAGEIGGVPHYLLIHPESITTDGGLRTFASVPLGMRIYGMRGDRRRLIDRARRVAAQAAAQLTAGPQALAGGLMVYCAGCMLAVGSQMNDVVSAVADSFAGSPFVGCFTFGEQGSIANRNVHGNLMISAIAFGR